jgi:hypothetical protein
MVAQIYKQNTAMVAYTMTPTRDPHIFADMGVAECSASVRTVAMHGKPRLYQSNINVLGERM